MHRSEPLDALRAVALFGVAVVNYATIFRGPLLASIDEFHTRPELVHRITDWVIGVGIESKAFAIYTLLFGAGIAAWAERPILRRLIALLAIGAVHMALWNGDILVFYALLGLALAPFRQLSSRALVVCAAGLFVLALTDWVSAPLPSDHGAWIRAARDAYESRDFARMFSFRSRETQHVIVPLLVGAAPRAASMMLLGMAAWKERVLLEPANHRKLLRWTFAVGAIIGVVATALDIANAMQVVSFASHAAGETAIVALAIAYASILLLVFARRAPRILSRLGRVSLTCYLMQTVIASIVFFGFGLFDRLGSFTAAMIAIAVYAAQAAIAPWLLASGQGPMERLWRRASS